ncbi:MAG: metallophosphoesterase [Acidimicrobiia bacterium]|nr:metallophosphoesterase [Acidimicrobiia bacterium]
MARRAPGPGGEGEIRDAEVTTVGVDELVVTFVSEPGVEVATRLGEVEVSTAGPHHVVRFGGLAPGVELPLRVGDHEPEVPYLPASVTTLERPRGRLLATLATVNDVHFGETECGKLGTEPEVGPVLTAEPGEAPYPRTMSLAAAAEIDALDPQAVVAKGDLTSAGTEEEYAEFLAVYGRFGARLHHVRGNHDAMLDPELALNGAPFVTTVGGVTLAVVDTVTPGTDRGCLPRPQLLWLDDVAAATSGPVLVFGHHHLWNLHADPDRETRKERYFGISPDDSEELARLVRRHENVVGYFAGHTHRNRVRRYDEVRNVPFVEVACVKDYPGAWAEYRVYESGFTQVVHRIAVPEALDWTERTRHMFAGLYRDYALGSLEERCFTVTW